MRGLRILGWIIGGVLGLVLLVVVVIAVGVNTGPGHRAIESLARMGGVEITGLQGRVPDDLHAERITMADARGVWLEIDGLVLSWSPRALLKHEINADLLSADRVHVSRYPAGGGSSGGSTSSGSGGFDWKVAVAKIHAPKIELPEIALSLEGSAIYQQSGVAVKAAAATADAMGQGPASLDLDVTGPLDAVAISGTITGKGLTTQAKGHVNVTTLAGDLTLGFDHPDFAGVSAARLDVSAKGSADAATVHAVLEGLRLPGPQPLALGDGPLTLDATYGKSARPEVSAHLTAGAAAAADGMKIDAVATYALADSNAALKLSIDRLDNYGVSARRVDVEAAGNADALDLHAVVAGLAAPGMTPAMLGAAPLKVDAKYRKGGSPEFVVALAGDTATLDAQGKLPVDRLSLDTHIVLPNLAAFAPSIGGHVDLSGHVEGAFDNFAVKARTDATVTASGVTSPITADIDASGLPGAPAGRVLVKGAYGGQPVSLDVSAAMGGEKRPVITVAQAAWQNIVAHGAFTLAADNGLPTGQLVLEAKRLPAPTTSGSARATIDLTREGVTPVLKVVADVASLAVQGTSLAHSVLSGVVTDPIGEKPVISASLALDGLATGAFRQAVRIEVSGPQDALAIKLGVTGTAQASAAATLDVPHSRVAISSLQGTAQGQTLRLAAPTTITYAPQIELGRTRLTLGGSSLDIQGKVSPALDLTAMLRAVPAELARIADPSLQAEGTLTAEARVQGTTQRPTGTIRVSGSGLRLRQPAGIPAVRLDATATLDGSVARLNAVIAASGITQLRLAGGVPLAPGGAYDLTANGRVDLRLLDPFLVSAGAQATGELALDARVTGTQPTPAGTLALHHGSISVPAQGARLSDIDMLARAQPDRIVLESLTAKAGAGTLSGSGSVGLAAPMPVDIRLTAKNASPLSSDLLTAIFDADLSVQGAVQTALNAGGTIRLQRAEINIPQRLPSSLPVLAVRQKGPPPPPAPPPAPINLDITLVAPGQIFVRGRGLEAELGGQLHIGGTAASPKPEGGFSLRRGQYSLAGQNLDFSTGKVGFDGNLPIDPSLNFVATSSTQKVTATLSVTGSASHPKIALSSVPELPQDEVLAQLLFRRSASELGPLQLAQIAAALAQIADAGGSGGLDPLGSLRKGLGLDVLSVGGTPGASPTVEAGRNLGHGIYVGAKQSTAGSGSQATLRLDLAKGLRLEADLGVAPAQSSTPAPGAPPTGNQVGVTYEFDY